jgi:uncharacterized repeat protein (TIGR03803 family)
MKNETTAFILKTVTVLVTLTLVTDAFAATEKQLYSFNSNSKSGMYPYASVISDTAGNLYGTTLDGGASRDGEVFELVKPTGRGGWIQRILHSFANDGTDGYRPYASLVMDGNGNLYGTTNEGGSYGWGMVFELAPQAGGGWTETILHSFNRDGTDGYYPYAGLILDGSDDLYGTTPFGGANGVGTVFELAFAGGIYTENILYSFKANGEDGNEPFDCPIFDAAGNLYGTTSDGGAFGGGTVFELTLAGGSWTESTLYNFSTSDGDPYAPYAGLIFDGDGNLYGTTLNGGAGYGAVFELSPPAGGNLWTETTLHSFDDNGKDGTTSYGGVVLDSAGNLYGDTMSGGSNGKGVVFKLVRPTGKKGWTEKILHSFNTNEKGIDGEVPRAGLFPYAGSLYGTTSEGGRLGGGTVFEVVP